MSVMHESTPIHVSPQVTAHADISILLSRESVFSANDSSYSDSYPASSNTATYLSIKDFSSGGHIRYTYFFMSLSILQPVVSRLVCVVRYCVS